MFLIIPFPLNMHTMKIVLNSFSRRKCNSYWNYLGNIVLASLFCTYYWSNMAHLFTNYRGLMYITIIDFSI